MRAVEALGITATITGRHVSRDEVLKWQGRRAAAVYRKLRMGSPPDDLMMRREALVAMKLGLGHAEIERRLARQTALAGRSSRLMTALSRGERRLCVVELRGRGASAEAVPVFYRAAMDAGDEAPLLAAAPDHWLLCKLGDGIQQVIETTGGSPLASPIFPDENEVGSIETSADPSFPVQWVAFGRTRLTGRPAGALRHTAHRDPRLLS